MKLQKLLPWAWLIMCTILFLLPGSSFGKSFTIKGLDKIVHFSLFFIFTCLILNAYAPLSRIVWCLFIVLSLSYIFAIEYIQKTYIPGRGFEFEDILSNICGILIALVFFPLINKLKVKNQ